MTSDRSDRPDRHVRSDLPTENRAVRAEVPDLPSVNPGRRLVHRFVALLVIALTVYLIHRLVAEVGWTAIKKRLALADYRLVLLAFVAMLARLAVWSYRWHLAVRRLEAPRRSWVLYLALPAAAAFNLLAPIARVASGLLRARYLSRAGVPSLSMGELFGVVLFDQVAHLAVMLSLTLVGLVVGAVVVGRMDVVVVALVLIGSSVVVAVVWWRRRVERGRGGLLRFLGRRVESGGWIARAISGGRSAIEVFGGLARRGELWWRVIALGLVVFGLGALGQWLVFRSLDTEVPFLFAAIALAMGLAAGSLVGTPGGLGATEAAMIALFVTLGVERADAASGVLLFRAIHYASVLAIGVPAGAALEAILLNGGPGDLVDETPQAE